jgi:hypothetical protein
MTLKEFTPEDLVATFLNSVQFVYFTNTMFAALPIHFVLLTGCITLYKMNQPYESVSF